MAYTLSPKQREIQERETTILDAARSILLADGFHALTMNRVADVSSCPKGTMYQHFSSKEDVVLALAQQYLEDRYLLMKRGARFEGRARERLASVGEGLALYSRMKPEEMRIIRMATGAVREKASVERVKAVMRIESDIVDIVRDVIRDAVAQNDLVLTEIVTVDHLTFVIWAMVDGAFFLVEEGFSKMTFKFRNPLHELWIAFSILADGYQWTPLSPERDWEEVLAQARRTVFPKESQIVYGDGAWYGDAGGEHPMNTHYWQETP